MKPGDEPDFYMLIVDVFFFSVSSDDVVIYLVELSQFFMRTLEGDIDSNFYH